MKKYIVVELFNEEYATILHFTKEELLEFIREEKEEYGDTVHFLTQEDKKLKLSSDEQYYLVIEGNVVLPKQKKVILEYDV